MLMEQLEGVRFPGLQFRLQGPTSDGMELRRLCMRMTLTENQHPFCNEYVCVHLLNQPPALST